MPLLFFEVLAAGLESFSDKDTTVGAVISSCLIKSGLTESPTSDQIEYSAMRMEMMKDEEQKKEDEDKKPLSKTGKKAFAQDALEWLSSLVPENLCLYIANYNLDEASRLYCEVDREDVMHMGSQKVEQEWEMMRVKMEASLFGFGGGYEGSGSSDKDTTVVDLTNGDTTGLDKFFGKAN